MLASEFDFRALLELAASELFTAATALLNVFAAVLCKPVPKLAGLAELPTQPLAGTLAESAAALQEPDDVTLELRELADDEFAIDGGPLDGATLVLRSLPDTALAAAGAFAPQEPIGGGGGGALTVGLWSRFRSATSATDGSP